MDISIEKKLSVLAANIRIDVLRMIEKAGQGHMGGSLSIVDLLAVLYGKQMKYDVNNPSADDRDMLVLSKGHAAAALYSTLSNVGFFDKSILLTMNEGGTTLPSHPDRNKVPGVEMTTGSLGQGTSVAAGIALAYQLENNERNVYLIVGDGELNEGQCWEAFQFIAHYNLNNCIVIIDENKKQIDGTTEEVMNPYDLVKKMESFGFHSTRVKGDDLVAIDTSINAAKERTLCPTCIVLDTIKGQGVPFYENMSANHSVKFTSEIAKMNQSAIKELLKFIEEVQ